MAKFVVRLTDEAATDAERFGPKAANQAALGHAGLPTPGGFVLGADAYFHQLESLGLVDAAEQAVSLPFMESRGPIAEVRIGLFSEPIAADIEAELLDAYRTLTAETGMRLAVRSSSLMEDTEGSSFAGQFQTFLGIEGETDFLTAVRACWGALWSPQAMRYMQDKKISAIDTAMSVLVQPLIEAEASGGGLSQTADGGMSVSATWGLGEALAQGEVVPDRYDLTSEGKLVEAISARNSSTAPIATRIRRRRRIRWPPWPRPKRRATNTIMTMRINTAMIMTTTTTTTTTMTMMTRRPATRRRVSSASPPMMFTNSPAT